MEVLGGGSSRAASQGDRIAGLYDVVDVNQVAAVVRVERFDAVIVPDDNGVAVTAVRFRHADHPGQRCANGVAGNRFDVDAGMHGASPIAIRGDQFARIGIDELLLKFVQIDRQFARRGERVIAVGR